MRVVLIKLKDKVFLQEAQEKKPAQKKEELAEDQKQEHKGLFRNDDDQETR